MTFGERLTKIRKENGFARRNAFAEVLGIPETTLRNYETDAREPGHTFLIQISKLFNVSIDWLLGNSNDKELTNYYQLKATEYAQIEKYRKLDSHGKEMVDFTLSKEYERSVTEKNNNNIITTIQTDADYLLPNAAHERTDIKISEEERIKDENMLD